jgi:DNA-binding CsgD family transcriptional regulator
VHLLREMLRTGTVAVSTDDHEVWANISLANVRLHEEAGISVERLLAGLPFDEAGLQRRKRVAWSDHVTILERLCEAVGGLREFEDLVAGGFHQVTPELRTLAAAVISPTTFYRFALEVVSPILVPPVKLGFDDLGDNRVRVTSVLSAGARPSEAFFHGATGAMRSFSAHLDLPLATVLESDVGSTHGTWVLQLPPARTLIHRAYRRAQRLVVRLRLGSEADGTPVDMVVGTSDLDPTAARVESTIHAWKLTPRQVDVLALVIAGRSNKEIASELVCAENTIELHVSRLLRKTNTSSRTHLIAHFWSDSWGFPQ